MASSVASLLAFGAAIVTLDACSIAMPPQPALEIGVRGPTTHLDPARGDEPGTTLVGRLAFQTLPRLSTGIERSPDARAWVFSLRSGRAFADGTPLDARAVVANFARWRSDHAGANAFVGFARTFTDARYSGNAIVDVAALDATRVRIRTSGPFPDLPRELDDVHFSIASPTAFARGNDAFDREPVGSGPFAVVPRGAGADIAFVPDHREETAGYASAAIRDVPDPHTSELSLELGDLLVFYGFEPRYFQEARANRLVLLRDAGANRWCVLSPRLRAPVRACPPLATSRVPAVKVDATHAIGSMPGKRGA